MSSNGVAISVKNLSKAYTIQRNVEKHSTLAESLLARLRRPLRRAPTDTFRAIDDVSMEINKGDVVGVIGRNGAGKSTLLKVLSRITEPTSGGVDLYGRVGSLLEVGTGFHPELTGRENVFLNGAIIGMTRSEVKKQFDAIVDFAGVEKFLETPVKRYSSGMYVRLAFAVAAHLDCEIMIIDEVLAVGDSEFQRKCLGKMQDVAGSGRTVIFVSHNMAAVSALCTRGAFLANGRLLHYGNVEDAVAQYIRASDGNEFRPRNGPLRSISAVQEAEVIRIEASFEHDHELALPNLGFVIYDYMGTPVCGLNPFLSGVDKVETPMRSGKISAEITEPRLLDGRYHLSVWFGDGKEDFVSFPNCISFDVAGMAGPRQLPASSVGAAFPRCNWRFTSESPVELAAAN